MSRRLAALGLAIAPLLAGCAVPVGAAEGMQINSCSTSADCGGDGVCQSNVCVATSVDLAGLLLEVSPPSNASFGANTSYIVDPSRAISLDTSGTGKAFVVGYDPPLPTPIAIVGGTVRLNHAYIPASGCSLADGSVPAKITFYSVPRYAGLPLSTTTVTTVQRAEGYTFDAQLVPDTYDVHVEPQLVAGCNGDRPLPPVFYPRVNIAAGGALSWELPVPGKLTGSIKGFNVVTGDWTVDVVEPSRGLPISANASLTTSPSGGAIGVFAQISWHDKDAPILRLTPPPGTAQPTVFWSLATAAGGSQDNPTIDFSVEGLATDPIHVGGQIRDHQGIKGSPAVISIQSISLLGTDAHNAAYSLEGITTGKDGSFDVHLPPGKYRVRAFPTDERFAVTTSTLEVPAAVTECYCGKGFNLFEKVPFSGDVSTANDDPLRGAAVIVSPSQTVTTSYWDATHNLDALTARTVTDTTRSDGGFGVNVDPGGSGVDLTIQPGAGSNFPWLVKPGILLHGGKSSSWHLTNPAILKGTVRDPSGAPVANADVNAWFPIRKPGGSKTKIGTAVLIGTVPSDANGGYTLVMPAHVD